ncbi:hypothetical protein MMC29_006633 [Sticta canariensis]|nr:hypothetical protein [Sticta canariensis]
MQNLSVPYMPKLQYRTSSSDSENLPLSDSISPVSPVSTSFSLGTVSTAPTSRSSSDLGPLPNSKDATPQMVSSPDVRSSVVPPSRLSPTIPVNQSKKRGGSFFSFFGVKEPSQQAFDDYQRHMRKKGTGGNGRATAVGLPGVSSAKLPPTVPKVNSRWDGIPQILKEKEKQKRMTSSESIGGRSRSIRTSGSEKSTSTTTSSTRSRGSSCNPKTRGRQQTHAANPTDLYGWESASGSSGSITRNDIKAHDEAFKLLSITTSPKPYITTPQTPPLPSRLPGDYPKNTPADTGLLLGPSSSSSYVQSDPCIKSGLRTTTVEITDTDEIVLNSNGLHFLGPPASARRKTRDPRFLAVKAEEMTTPDKDFSPDTASTTDHISHESSSFGSCYVSSKDVNLGSYVAKGANRGTANTGTT